MYQRDFDKLLAKRRVPRSLMIFGDSLFLIDRYFQEVKELFQPEEITTLYNFDYTFEGAKGSISQGSLFASSSMLVVKSEEKLPNRELKELIKVVEANEDSFFIYLFYGDNFKDNQSAFGSNFLRLFNPNFYEIKNITFSEIAKLDFQISEAGVDRLIYLKNMNISMIVSEISKLANYGKRSLDERDIHQLVSPSGDAELDKMIGFLFINGDYRKIVQYITLHGIDEVVVITYMLKFVEEIYLFRSALQRGDSIDSLSVMKRKLPPKVEQEKIGVAKRYNLKQVEKILTLLMKVEIDYKSGNSGDKTGLLVSNLIQIEKILRNS